MKSLMFNWFWHMQMIGEDIDFHLHATLFNKHLQKAGLLIPIANVPSQD